MGEILGKLTFRFLVGQLLPGIFLLATGLSFGRLEMLVAPITPLDVISAYANVTASIRGAAALLVIVAAAAGLGIILQGISSAMEANVESFRAFRVSPDGGRVPLSSDETRPRSALRAKVAMAWSERSLGILLLIAPFLAAFDLLSLAAAKPRHVYKDLYALRSQHSESHAIVLSDYQYVSGYFANATIALLLAQLAIVPLYKSALGALLMTLTVYVTLGVHYLLWRTSKSSLDHALLPSLAPRPRDRGTAPRLEGESSPAQPSASRRELS